MNVNEILGADGLFARNNPRHEVRDGQLALAQAVLRNMQERAQLIAEAPTGTGKSMAYLVPAALMAREKKRTVIVTANIALQEQLVQKDLPALAALMPEEYRFKYAMLKGISNYLCLDAFDGLGNGRGFFDEEARDIADIVAWRGLTQMGDMSELAREPGARVRRLATVSSEECLGNTCDYRDDCFALRARKAAQDADILVVNYHLFFIDAKLRVDDAGFLPAYDHVVFDEGHAAPDIAREFFGARTTRYSVVWCARLLAGRRDREIEPIDGELKIAIEAAAEGFFGQLGELYHGPRYDVRFREPVKIATSLPTMLRRAAAKYSSASLNAVDAKARYLLAQSARRCLEVSAAIEFSLEYRQPSEYVHYLQPQGHDRVAVELVAKQIDCSKALRKVLFDRVGISKTVVSATLKTNGSFAFYRREFGMDNPGEFECETPFDLRRNMLFCFPLGMPDPVSQAPLYQQAVCRLLGEVANATQGRLLGLFTSHKMLEQAYQAIVAQSLPYTILKQGQAPRTRLIESFKADHHSILLGTDSLWEGIDVPGGACSAVVIDRLPFETPNDPIVSVMAELSRNSFFEYVLPRAVIALRQGAGRLIRTKTDRGVVVVLDPRIITKPYGRQFMRDFPATVGIVRSLGEIVAFLSS